MPKPQREVLLKKFFQCGSYWHLFFWFFHSSNYLLWTRRKRTAAVVKAMMAGKQKTLATAGKVNNPVRQTKAIVKQVGANGMNVTTRMAGLKETQRRKEQTAFSKTMCCNHSTWFLFLTSIQNWHKQHLQTEEFQPSF